MNHPLGGAGHFPFFRAVSWAGRAGQLSVGFLRRSCMNPESTSCGKTWTITLLESNGPENEAKFGPSHGPSRCFVHPFHPIPSHSLRPLLALSDLRLFHRLRPLGGRSGWGSGVWSGFGENRPLFDACPSRGGNQLLHGVRRGTKIIVKQFLDPAEFGV